MSFRIVYEKNGVAAIVCPSPEFIKSGKSPTEMNGHPGSGVPHVQCDESEIPSDRTFRNAWKLDVTKGPEDFPGKPIKCDMAKAVALAKDKVREVRNPKLAALDVEYQRADESNDNAGKAAVVAKKNQLRDAPADARLVAASDHDGLKAAMEAVIADVEAL